MNICLNCGESTKNPKFCSRSCAATLNGSKYPKRVKSTTKVLRCAECAISLKKGQSKYCSFDCMGAARRKKSVEDWQAGLYDGKDTLPPSVRSWILDKQDGSCSMCPVGITWEGKPLVLVLDHINGNSSDNSVENLRFVCPNCDSQLPTYKARNRGKGRHYRSERYKHGKSY